jgi:cohesin complex subunit SCC1
MFYSDSILARKGPLANIWLAAHWERKLSKVQVASTDIPNSVKELTEGSTLPPLALRLKGQLLLGIVRIYTRKTRYLLEDCGEIVSKLRTVCLLVCNLLEDDFKLC